VLQNIIAKQQSMPRVKTAFDGAYTSPPTITLAAYLKRCFPISTPLHPR
jgi:hypothetical protein